MSRLFAKVGFVMKASQAHILHLLLLATCSLGLEFTQAAEAQGQQRLYRPSEEVTAEILTLRHIFYHDLEDPAQKSAAFIDFVTLSPQIHGTHPEGLRVRPTKENVYTTEENDPGRVQRQVSETTTPNITDKETIINLATMTSDVYLFNSSNSGWHNLSQGFNDSLSFGYKKDGLQGHLFANADNSTVVVAFKGTSITPWDKTRTKDRLNDNLLFSCCCATQRPLPYRYSPVCSCRQGTYQCNSTCLTDALCQKDLYYAAASSVVQNVTRDLFPKANVWLVGHSLGGALASLVGMTFDLPVVTFESPPERVPARRLGLVASNDTGVQRQPRFPAYHFGNSADPIYMGSCNGVLSTCAALGYSFESQCFTGKVCKYNTSEDKGWRQNIANHRIDTVIESVLKAYDDVPKCEDESDECVDCYSWDFH